VSTNDSLHPKVLRSIRVLADFLMSEVRVLEQGSEAARKEAREQIPSDRVKDAAALARELRWRARAAAGLTSDDEDDDKPKAHGRNGKPSRANLKRKIREDSPAEGPLFRNFAPKPWDTRNETTTEDEMETRRCQKPSKDEDLGRVWGGEWVDVEELSDGTEEAEVRRRRNKVVKVRHIAGGLEREQIERVVEEWIWR
jgi:F-box and leucine-rich repeat protein 10/11